MNAFFKILITIISLLFIYIMFINFRPVTKENSSLFGPPLAPSFPNLPWPPSR